MVLSDPTFALTESQLRSAALFVNQNLQNLQNLRNLRNLQNLQNLRQGCGADDNVLRCCEKLVAIEGVGVE